MRTSKSRTLLWWRLVDELSGSTTRIIFDNAIPQNDALSDGPAAWIGSTFCLTNLVAG